MEWSLSLKKRKKRPTKSMDFCQSKTNLREKNLLPSSACLHLFPQSIVKSKSASGKHCPGTGNGFLWLLTITVEIDREQQQLCSEE